MKNDKLRQLVALYLETRDRLYKLKEEYDRGSIEEEILIEMEVLCRKKEKSSSHPPVKEEWKTLLEKIYSEYKRAKSETDKSKKLDKSKKREIIFLQKKLEACKKIIGKENMQQLEENEKEKILNLEF